MENKKSYKYCIVPQCNSTTNSTPDKDFFYVPENSKTRTIWLNAIRREDGTISYKTRAYVCADHFEIENDVTFVTSKNGEFKRRLKPGVVPHIFDCQPSRSAVKGKISRRCVSGDRNKKNTTEVEVNDPSDNAVPQPDLVSQDQNDQVVGNNDTLCQDDFAIQETSHCDSVILESDSLFVETYEESMFDGGLEEDLSFAYRDCGTNVTFDDLGIVLTCNCPPKSKEPSSQLQPPQDDDTLSQSPESYDDDDDSFRPSNEEWEHEDAWDSEEEEEDKHFAMLRLQATRYLMNKHPRLYMRVPEDCVFIIDKLVDRIHFVNCKKIEKRDTVLLVLRKIRLKESFFILGNEFGISKSYATKIFLSVIPVISRNVKQLIHWPDRQSIKRNLPAQFRGKYSKVESIIDAFEIEIEKPSCPVKQALTWSDYKKANTMKYLISITPNGLVNFVSKGHSGRISDLELTKVCGYTEQLKSGAVVMADRGFKQVADVLNDLKCELIRPASVESGVKCDGNVVKESRQIAALRGHVERAIRRVREFLFVAPHACVDHYMVLQLDHCVNIACGLTNLQSSLIKF